jgi:putative nucleotidyltransferase with HDIG domain
MDENALEQLVNEIRDLPLTVSDVLAQVIAECDNAQASVSSLSRLMAADQALAAMVLKLANSAYYGYARRIESLPDAVVLLGFSSVKNLAITASITRLLAPGRDDLSSVREQLFEHSLCTAACAKVIGRNQRISGDKAFLAGLLHDLGTIVLVCSARERYAELVQAAADRGVRPELVELDVLGFGHAELGARAAAEWQFPQQLCEAIRFHHEPALCEGDARLVRVVHAADWLSEKMRAEDGVAPFEADPEVFAALIGDQAAQIEAEALETFDETLSLRAAA